MDQATIFGPFFAMMFLTFVVWVYMYIRRISFITVSKLSPKDVAVPGELRLVFADESQTQQSSYTTQNDQYTCQNREPRAQEKRATASWFTHMHGSFNCFHEVTN